MKGYIDIHTHHKAPLEYTAIMNLSTDFDKVAEDSLYSVGLHPWYLKSDTIKMEVDKLKRVASLPNIIAIGECGLDKVTTTDWVLQVQAFEQQISIANEYNKPLIIHCVRAYEEVMDILKAQEVAVPVIFHGFNKNIQLAKQLLRAGYYLSFGSSLLKEHAQSRLVIADMPIDRLFLETDNAPISIREVYDVVALLRKTGMDNLILQLQNNFETVFKQ